MLRSSFSNLMFAIIARMLCGKHLNISCGLSRTQATQEYEYEALPLPPNFPLCNPCIIS